MNNILRPLVLLLLLIGTCSLSCQKELKGSSDTPQRAILSGTWKYPKMVSPIGLTPQSYLPITNFNRETFLEFSNMDSIYNFVADCNSSRGAYIAAVNSLMQIVFISPGDSLTFVVDTIPANNYWGKEIIFRFSGKNAAHYNYGFMADSAVKREQGPKIEKNNMAAYKNNLEKYRDKRLAFLKQYASMYSVSDEFYDYAKSDIINKYIESLYVPLGNRLITQEELPNNYFDRVEYIPSNRQLRSYWQAMRYKYLLSNPLFPHPEKMSFSIEYSQSSNEKLMRDYILNNFKGEQREYLYSTMIGIFVDKQDIEHYNTIKEMIDEAPKYVSDSMLLDFIKKADEVYKPSIAPIPDNILLSTKLKSYEDNQIYSLKEVLDKYKDKAIYIDFWASWCGPCLSDIKNSAEIKQFLEDQKIIYMYINIKDEEVSWKSAVKQNNIMSNQYFLQSSKEANLIDYYKVNEIPRYILLNSRHEIIDSRAPRPISNMKNSFVKRMMSLNFK